MGLNDNNTDGNIVYMIAKLFKRSKGNENDQEVQRRIFVNLDLPQDMIDPKSGLPSTNYPRNKIRTTKYTPVTFLPKNIFFQFTNIANSYFLLIIILGAFQIFGVQSPGMQAVPLIVIVVLTAIKDGFEDYRRAVSDLELNNSRIHILTGLDNPNVIKDHVGPWRRFKKACTRGMRATVRALSPKKKNQSSNDADNLELERVDTLISSIDTEHPARLSMSTNRSRPHAKLSPFHPGTVCNPNIKPDMALKFTNKYWKDISVGDIIRVRNNEEIPADAVILASSDPEGACYVETKNLDGETNLKNKVSIHCGQGLKHANDFERVQMAIETEAPNLNLYKFRGVIKYRGFESENDIEGKEMMEPATYENILLRGTTLRNTKWVLCAVVATGNDTKIMLNSGVTPTKKSRISKDLNLSVIFNFFILFILCFVSGLINGLYYRKDDTSRRFFEYKPYAGWNAAPNGVVAFFVALILYQTLVPISLYISIEIIKTVQAYFIYADVGMYYKKLDFPCTPKSWNISDDLGQIEYIFSDKTGTLTQNVMEFKKCTIAGKSYGLAYTEAQQGMDKRAGVDVVAENIKMQKVIKEDKLSMIEGLNTLDNDQLKDGAVTFISSEFVKDTLLSNDAARKQANEEFMLALSLCHTVITETTEDGYIDFKAESPDEAALVSVARDIGIVFREKTRSGQVITKYDPTKPLTYEILEIIPFNSTRKRMSIVLRGPDGRIIMYTKGADNVIYERLGPDSDEEILSKTAIHLSEFAQEGLRTLCIAQKYINSDDFEKWHAKYKEASNSIDDDREEKLELIGEELESGMTLLGGTAIEDRLQEGVPDSISILSKAGIKLWVLTGDKVETAINIGFSCNLLANEMELLVIKSNDDASPENETVDQLVATYLTDKFGLEGSASDLAEAKKDHSPPSGNFALIIDGVSLHQIFEDAELTLKFLLLCKQCRSVLCCRVSPAQKAQIVKMVKDNLNVMTLAVGDGANDVAMIQAANVGVGIAGEEGRQAVMSSDYAIGQFRFLVRLIIVHGRWSYKRLSEMIPCFFYKNVNFVMALFWFGIFDNFEGAYLYEYTYLMFFNLAFTSLPVIFLGILDQDVTDVVSLMVPELYRSGILGLEWSQFKFFYYMLDGAYQSVIAFYFPWLLYHKGVFVNQHGLGLDHRFWVGVFCAHISVISCNVYVLLQQKRWDWLSGIIYAFSILIIFFWTGVWSSSTASQEFYKVASQCYGTVAFWCVFFIGVLSSLLPRFSYDILNRLYYPKDIDIVRERAAMGDFKSYPSNYDPTDQELVAQFRAKVNETGSNSGSFSSEFDEKKDIEAGNVAIPAAVEFPGLGSVKTSDLNNTAKEDGGIGSRKNTIKRLLHLGNTKNDISKQKTPLEVMRENMVLRGEASARSSAQIIRSSHDLGIASAEGLMKLHTRNSNLSRS